MSSVEQHYENVLSDVYAWLNGGFAAALARNEQFFERHGIVPRASRRAVDLGAGCGFQTLPLARRGFSVLAIDLDRKLLGELREQAGDLDVEIVRGDLLEFGSHLREPVELIVCMVDTLTHLASRAAVERLLADAHAALERGGRLILTFRDLSHELTELDRFLPVRSDADTVFTCFLEYEPETVKVHDLVYRRTADGWSFGKSFYRKLRLSRDWVAQRATAAGFAVDSSDEHGFVTVVATRG